MTSDYTIEVRTGPLFGEEVVRSLKVDAAISADPVLDAINVIEGLRDTYENREEVVWEGEEVDSHGVLAGLASDGVSYRIVVTPPLPVETEPPTQPTLW